MREWAENENNINQGKEIALWLLMNYLLKISQGVSTNVRQLPTASADQILKMDIAVVAVQMHRIVFLIQIQHIVSRWEDFWNYWDK